MVYDIVCSIIFGFFIILGLTTAIEFFILKIFGTQASKGEISTDSLEFAFRCCEIRKAFTKSESIFIFNESNLNPETLKIYNILRKDYPLARDECPLITHIE